MVEKVEWQEPTDNSVTTVHVERSTTKYGAYTEIGTTSATSDGAAKSSSNTWVVEYTDSTGARTDWYKIRFWNGTNYSDYSEPTTQEQLLQLCTVDEVKDVIDTTGRWSDNEVFKTIKEVDDLIYIESGTPVKSVWSTIGKIDSTLQYRYYVGEENIYRVDRVFYGTTTKSELFLDDQYKVNAKYGMIEILPTASSGITPDTTCDIEIRYVPKVYNQLSIYRTCKRLLEKLDFTSGGTASKELEVIEKKLASIEQLLVNSYCLDATSRYSYYDDKYGVNRKKIVQDHDRNLYISSYGW